MTGFLAARSASEIVLTAANARQHRLSKRSERLTLGRQSDLLDRRPAGRVDVGVLGIDLFLHDLSTCPQVRRSHWFRLRAIFWSAAIHEKYLRAHICSARSVVLAIVVPLLI